jgi:hypothetical protein
MHDIDVANDVILGDDNGLRVDWRSGNQTLRLICKGSDADTQAHLALLTCHGFWPHSMPFPSVS